MSRPRWATINQAVAYVPLCDGDVRAWLRDSGLICRVVMNGRRKRLVDLDAVDAAIRAGQVQTVIPKPARATGSSPSAAAWSDL